MSEQRFDLEDRLLDFSVRIIRVVDGLPNTRVGNHVGGQILRSGTSPFAHHGEAQGAESRKDFIHKLRIGLKELRETKRWLRLIQAIPLIEPLNRLEEVLEELEELIKIFVTSIRTAERNE